MSTITTGRTDDRTISTQGELSADQKPSGIETYAAADAAQKSAGGSKKSASAFRTISEVADELDVQQHVLRFWETKFSQVRPLKRGGGRRYYRPEDVQFLKAIHCLLYTRGYTIKGVQKLLREEGKKKILEDTGVLVKEDEGTSSVSAPAQKYTEPAEQKPASGLSQAQRETLNAVLDELKDLRATLRGEN